jgi:hypothetical protein
MASHPLALARVSAREIIWKMGKVPEVSFGIGRTRVVCPRSLTVAAR